MPPSLRPSHTMSFGHLSAGRSPVTASIPSTAASPRHIGSCPARWAGSAGRRSSDINTLAPGGAHQERSSRPRPAVCSSASTSRPSAAPAAASSWATSFVEPMLGKKRVGRPKRRVVSAAMIVSAERSDIVASLFFFFFTSFILFFFYSFFFSLFSSSYFFFYFLSPLFTSSHLSTSSLLSPFSFNFFNSPITFSTIILLLHISSR